MIPAGIHCSDLILTDAEANQGVKDVVDKAVAQIKAWVGEYYQK